MGLKTFIKKSFYNIKFIKKKNSQIKNHVILITGASSGRGLMISFNSNDNKIIAIYNNNEKNLKEIKSSNLTYLKCDLSNINNYQEIEKKIIENDIELVFNCAGQFGSKARFEKVCEGLNILKINSLSILKILQFINNHNKMKYIKKNFAFRP